MTREDLGFIHNPANGLGIVRARTLLGNLRLWDIPRSEQALQTVIGEIGLSPIPALYILIDERADKKVYIGQSEDILTRLMNHLRNPDEKIKSWQRALIFNDGRNASQSDLNDENIRLTLENYLVALFKINRYQVVTSAFERDTVDLFIRFDDEHLWLVYKQGQKDITAFCVLPYSEKLEE